MVKYNVEQLDALFGALADKTRRGIVHSLASGTATASELAMPHQMSLPAVSKHLKILEKASLIERKVSGRSHYFSLNTASLNQATDWISEQQIFWEHRLGNLANYLNSDDLNSDDLNSDKGDKQ